MRSIIEFFRGKKTNLLGLAMVAGGVAAVAHPAVAAALPALGLAGISPGTLVLGGLALIFGRDAVKTEIAKLKK